MRFARPSRALDSKPWEMFINNGLFPRFQLQGPGSLHYQSEILSVRSFEFQTAEIVAANPLNKRDTQRRFWLSFDYSNGTIGAPSSLSMQQIGIYFQLIQTCAAWRWEPWIPEDRYRNLYSLGYVYFTQSPEGGLIKIGYSTKPAARLSTMQSGCPLELKVLRLLPALQNLEGHLHNVFRSLRRRGEWFHPGPDLVQFIAGLPRGIYSSRLKDLGEPVSEQRL